MTPVTTGTPWYTGQNIFVPLNLMLGSRYREAIKLLSFLEKPRFSQQDQLRIEVTFSNQSLLLYANEKTSE